MLTRHAKEILVDHQNGFRRSRLTTDHIFCIRQILKKKCKYNEALHKLFINFKKAYHILIEFGIPVQQLKLIKMCLNETYSRVRVGKHLSDIFPINNYLKQRDALSTLFFNFALDYAIRKVQVNKKDGLNLMVHISFFMQVVLLY
jgi:hypothetical protein